MNYVISDIHGRIDLFEKMLDKINLKDGDMLYVLGDCIDRGGGLEVALKLSELKKKGLVTFILGNHELIYFHNLSLHKTNHRIMNDYISMNQIKESTKKIKAKQELYSKNPTISSLIGSFYNVYKSFSNIDKMNQYNDEIRSSILNIQPCSESEEFETWDSLNNMTDEEIGDISDLFFQCNTYEIVNVGSKQYILSHGGIYYTKETMQNLFVRDVFYKNPVNKEILKEHGASPDCTVIFGHTTTRDINIELNGTYIAPNKIWFDTVNNDKIGIDCGASFPNGQLACLRLEDMKEFYVKNEDRFIVNPKTTTKFLQKPKSIFDELYPKLVEFYSKGGVVDEE